MSLPIVKCPWGRAGVGGKSCPLRSTGPEEMEPWVGGVWAGLCEELCIYNQGSPSSARLRILHIARGHQLSTGPLEGVCGISGLSQGQKRFGISEACVFASIYYQLSR